ncbi:MAG: hypothetical protein RLZZ339_1914 [Cyanobacteriota bacterium]|jgi:hypothetical protein|uniref:Uncharacterized protein n=3 Tax=Microcystis aeruginosa TaxID=1126 RepID=A0A0A1VSV8_MICAE|nr:MULTISPECIES: hypothetical protein [Microcystis]MBC1191158.1 hypothetical protein [Microcystis aeruginosa BLCC-F108]MBE9074119.1 hypothetical protein [Microcystis sp. LEGE 08355]MCA2591501.1 hypothetical protein [Microcystis sp. M31BS1]MCZ8119540.1 hypothetical protein [Microcystis sp. LE18-22.4A]MDB9408942.1 hypothetical protein [Microcystis aeruginosa CS-558/01A06]
MSKIFIANLKLDRQQNSLISLEMESSPLIQAAIERSLDARKVIGGIKTCGWICPMEF